MRTRYQRHVPAAAISAAKRPLPTTLRSVDTKRKALVLMAPAGLSCACARRRAQSLRPFARGRYSGAFEQALAGGGADRDPVTLAAHEGKVGDTSDIDQPFRPGEPAWPSGGRGLVLRRRSARRRRRRASRKLARDPWVSHIRTMRVSSSGALLVFRALSGPGHTVRFAELAFAAKVGRTRRADTPPNPAHKKARMPTNLYCPGEIFIQRRAMCRPRCCAAPGTRTSISARVITSRSQSLPNRLSAVSVGRVVTIGRDRTERRATCSTAAACKR